MDRDRADAVRRRIVEAHRRQTRTEIAGLKAELVEIRRGLYGLVDRLSRVATRLQAQEDFLGQEDSTVALPALSNKKPQGDGPGASS